MAPFHSKASRFLHTLTCWLHGGQPYGSMEMEHDHAKAKPGFVPVYVVSQGKQPERFLVKLKHLEHPLFRKLLEIKEEELGFENSKLLIPCDVSVFQNVIWHIESCKDSAADAGREEDLLRVLSSGCVPSSSNDNQRD